MSAASEERYETLKQQNVSKKLRGEALSLVGRISDDERRTHARAYIMYRGRTAPEVRAFIQRMNRAEAMKA